MLPLEDGISNLELTNIMPVECL